MSEGADTVEIAKLHRARSMRVAGNPRGISKGRTLRVKAPNPPPPSVESAAIILQTFSYSTSHHVPSPPDDPALGALLELCVARLYSMQSTPLTSKQSSQKRNRRRRSCGWLSDFPEFTLNMVAWCGVLGGLI